MIAVDDGFDARVDDVGEGHLVGQSLGASAERVEGQHGVALVVVASLAADEDHLSAELYRPEVHATKVLDLANGTAAHLLAKLDHVAVRGDDEDVAVADDGAGQAACEGQVGEVGGLADARVEGLDGRGVPVVALGASEDEDLLAQHGC